MCEMLLETVHLWPYRFVDVGYVSLHKDMSIRVLQACTQEHESMHGS